jgi:CubicO group peptidase (beta-lactamase class C family)
MGKRHSVKRMLIGMMMFACPAAILGASPPPVDAGRATGPSMSPAGAADLSQVLTLAVARHDTPGVVALVVDREGVLYEGAAGRLRDGSEAPMPSDAIFRIASMTKPVTSVAIMILREQHKLELDDPVAKFLPGFDNPKVITTFNETDATYQTRPAAGVMTIRHLLTHTSGIGYGFSNPIVHRLLTGSEKNEWELPLLQDPGTKWTYGASTRVLGMIVERLSGESLEDFSQERIFKPLGMVDTSYAVATDKQARVTSSYRHVDGTFRLGKSSPIPSTPTPPLYGDGGLFSTAHDYGRFIRMLLNGGHLGNARVLSAQSVRLMSQNQIGAIFVTQQPAADPALTKPFPLGAGRDKFGLGFQITAPDPSTIGYRSPGSLSWAGLYNTEFWIDPHRHIGGVLLMQFLPFYDDGAIRTLREFEAAVYKELPVH